jgi:hypothetical protein
MELASAAVPPGRPVGVAADGTNGDDVGEAEGITSAPPYAWVRPDACGEHRKTLTAASNEMAARNGASYGRRARIAMKTIPRQR